MQEIDKIFQAEIEEGNHESSSKTWEMIRLGIRGFAIQFSARKKKSRMNTLKILEHKISKYEKEINTMGEENRIIFTKKKTLEHLEKLKAERDSIIDYSTRGAMVRAKKNYLQFGEKNSKYFFSLEKYNYLNKNRFKLRKANGDLIINQQQILQEQKSFYKKLYKSQNIEIDKKYFKDLKLPRITEQQRIELDKEISSVEIKEAISQLRKEKTPGLDGFPVEFYRKVYSKWKGFFLSLFREISRYGLPESSRRGLINLIEKPERELLNLHNWRPFNNAPM